MCVCVRLGVGLLMDEEWLRMKRSIGLANSIYTEANASALKESTKRAIENVVDRCRVQRKRARALETPKDLSDEAICRAAKWTDRLPLRDYDNVLHLCPRLVNVVTVRNARIIVALRASRPIHVCVFCTAGRGHPRGGVGAQAAARLASDWLAMLECLLRSSSFRGGPIGIRRPAMPCPRLSHWPTCRNRCVAFHLCFAHALFRHDLYTTRVHTFFYRAVTGCAGPMEARLSIMRAVRQLALEADVHVHCRKFQVINQVGAASIDARLDCDAFARTHSATSHFDRASFVGLAWRPTLESICCEIYSTGRANLPGSTRQRSMLSSYARMVPELLRHSSRPDVYETLPTHLKEAHFPREVERDDAPLVSVVTKPCKPVQMSALWDDKEDAGGDAEALSMFASTDCSLDDDLALLEGAGF